ncbi:hypothetical protein MJO28_000218 [Puccinia striiformis f. sp. tritici]|uniref:Uncharacterized protein n=1 Tax=Puccinia striiformis f. sp. tritici TaxID=168172 RepID=A0ACC0EYK3_9BASI|nr:hypothetical protein MJO28_000218 [Puccinia striiformis f. sp. tritici]
MWVLGWRKAMATAQLIGRYIFQSAVDKNKEDYDNLMKTSDRASNILVIAPLTSPIPLMVSSTIRMKMIKIFPILLSHSSFLMTKFGIDFTKQKGVVKSLWALKKVQHCTLPPIKNNLYTCLAMSLQINIRTSKTCEKIQDGGIYNTKANKGKEMHLADHNYHLNKN